MAVFKRLAIPKCICERSKAPVHQRNEVVCTCPRRETYSLQYRDNSGKQILRNTDFTVKGDAERFEKGILNGLRSERRREVWDFLEGMRQRRAVCCLGDLRKAVVESKDKFRKSEKDMRRVVNDLYLVVAHALGLWTTESRSVHAHWQKKGTKERPDVGRIDALSSSVLEGDLVKKYFAARSEGGVIDWVEQREENTSINSTLGHARDLFRGKMALAIEGLELDGKKLKAFMEHPQLPTVSPVPEPVEGEVYQKMIESAERLKMGHRAVPESSDYAYVRPYGVYLANLAFRQTGMRVGSVVHLHKDWLRKMEDGWWMDVKRRKGGTAEYSLPISEELANLVRLSLTGYLLPGDDEAQRMEVLQAHNEWLKGIIGGLGELKQAAHRLRDTVAGTARKLWGIEVAAEVLGHADIKTTKKHYTRLRMDVTLLQERECGALGRLKVESALK